MTSFSPSLLPPLPLHPCVHCCLWLEQSLLSLRKQQSIACLAFSCDWLSHKLLKICVAIKHQHPDAHSSGVGVKPNSPSRSLDFEGRTTSSAGGATAPTQKLRQIGRKLSQLADDSLLCLRLEVRKVFTFSFPYLLCHDSLRLITSDSSAHGGFVRRT